MTLVCAAAVLLLSGVSVWVEEIKLGAGVTLKDATPIDRLVDAPADFVGKTIRVDGVATAVCESMGCWLAVSVDDSKHAKTVRLAVEDGVIVFPVSAKGRKVSAQGVFEKVEVTDEHGSEAAGEHAKQHPDALKNYHIKATGARISQ